MFAAPPTSARPVIVSIEEQLPAGLARAWQLVSDTETFNRVAGVSFSWTDRQNPDGGVTRTAVLRSMGIATHLEELVYDFEAPHHFRIVRRFLDGPISWKVVELELSGAGAATQLHYAVHLWPRVALLRPLVAVLAWATRRDLVAAFAAYRLLLEEDRTVTSLLPAPQIGRARAALAEAAAELAPPRFGAALAALIRDAPDHLLDRLEPRPLARTWGLSEDTVIEGCLAAVEARVLHLRWDLLCPSCLGAEALENLDEARGTQRHCPSCDLVYGADDPEAVAVSFRPAIKDFSRIVQCMGSPQRTPQVLARADLAPDQQVEWTLSLRPGAYRIRRNDSMGWTSLEVRDDREASQLTATVSDTGLAPAVLRAGPGWVRVVVRSVASASVRLLVERRTRPSDSLTAGELLERKVARATLARCGLLPQQGVQLRTVALLAVEVFSADQEAVAQVDQALRERDASSIHRDHGLLVSTWNSFDEALAAARHLQGSLRLCVALGYGAAVFPGPDAPPMGSAAASLLAALRGAMPGHTVVPQEHLALPPVRQALEDCEGLDIVAGPELEGPPSSALIFHSRCTFSLAPRTHATNHEGAILRERYRLEELLGSGGFGVVYSGIDVTTEDELVVKLLLPGRGASPEAIQAFFEEARVCAELDHPGVVGVRDFGHTDDGQLFLVMNRVPGLTLEQLREQTGTLSPDTVRAVAIDILEALDHVHTWGMLHRDIKPPNIMVDGSTASLIDFGIALRLQDAPTEDQPAVGTLRYISPEVLDGDPQDARTDLYSLGLVMFEALVGALPGEERGALAMAYGRVGQPLPLVSSAANQEVSEALATIIDRAVQAVPARRFASAREMAEALKGLA